LNIGYFNAYGFAAHNTSAVIFIHLGGYVSVHTGTPSTVFTLFNYHLRYTNRSGMGRYSALNQGKLYTDTVSVLQLVELCRVVSSQPSSIIASASHNTGLTPVCNSHTNTHHGLRSGESASVWRTPRLISDPSVLQGRFAVFTDCSH
jgi:hypothetical protein